MDWGLGLGTIGQDRGEDAASVCRCTMSEHMGKEWAEQEAGTECRQSG
jgi:hypothetical protein